MENGLEKATITGVPQGSPSFSRMFKCLLGQARQRTGT